MELAGWGQEQGAHLTQTRHVHGVTPCDIPDICLGISLRLFKQSVITFTEVFFNGTAQCTLLVHCKAVCVVTHTYFSRTAWTSIPEEFHLQVGASESKHIKSPHTLTHTYIKVTWFYTVYIHTTFNVIINLWSAFAVLKVSFFNPLTPGNKDIYRNSFTF